jgi:adenylate cyclase
MSGDPNQDYLADGMTDDVITELSRFSELFVIARNSSFQYKGKSVDIRQVGHELGVEYVLEGSVRRIGNHIRIGAQLIDAATGAHRWAERYDRNLKDIFAVQDEVACSIATILVAHVRRATLERRINKPPSAWQAYDYYIQAYCAAVRYMSSYKSEDIYQAKKFFERSLSIDPAFARAYASLAFIYATAWAMPHDSDYLNPRTLKHAHELAERALQIDPNLPLAHASLGAILMWQGQHDASVAAFHKALMINSNYTDWRFVAALIYAGEPERALDCARSHMRLDPFYPAVAAGFAGFALYLSRNYRRAIPLLRECASRAPNLRGGHLWLAVTYAQLGWLKQARAEAAEVLRIEPNWTIKASMRVNIFKNPRHAAHYFGGMRKAGLPQR